MEAEVGKDGGSELGSSWRGGKTVLTGEERSEG